MKFYSEYHGKDDVVKKLAMLKSLVEPTRQYRFMEFCGGHTHAFFRYGLHSLLPANIELIHGPGCPVCVLPAERISSIIHLMQNHPEIVLYSYGDLMRVPSENRDSLLKARARGLDIRMVYNPLEILDFCHKEPDKLHVFFAIGFETTTPPTALLMLKARENQLQNLLIYSNHVLTPPAASALLENQEEPLVLDGIIGPGHVCTITGPHSFDAVANDFKIPVAISGFFPIDLIRALENLILQTHARSYNVVNTYSRSVKSEGNILAQEAVAQTFTLRQAFAWRGLGEIQFSALRISEQFSQFDLEERFSLKHNKVEDHPKCLCPQILKGQKKPLDCTLFGKACRPDNPMGACMVSGEGSCAAYYTYKGPEQEVLI